MNVSEQQPTVTLRVERPGREPRFAEYRVPTAAHTTVLDALEWIRSHMEPELLYRHSCHHGSCGTCGMLINGRQALACLTNLREAAAAAAATAATPTAATPTESTAPVELRPLPTMNHLGDLAVDPTPLFADFPRSASYLRSSEFNKEAERPREVPQYERFEDCIECGLCVSICPVVHLRPFTGPAALAAYNRELDKHPERGDELLPQIDTDQGVWGCDRHLECSRVCPTGVYPGKQIAQLQRKIEKRRGGE